MQRRLEMKKSIVSGCVVALLLMGLVGCEKKNDDAIVIGKDWWQR